MRHNFGRSEHLSGIAIPLAWLALCVCALTPAHLWGHSYEYTPAKWGLFKLWGHFRVPAKKVLLNLFFLGSKPHNWGHLRGPHKLVKNIHKLGPHKSVKFLILEKSVAFLCNRLSNSPQTLTPPWF